MSDAHDNRMIKLALSTRVFEQWATMFTNWEHSLAAGLKAWPIESTLKMNGLLLEFRDSAKPLIPIAEHFGIDAEPLRMICFEPLCYSDRPAVRRVLSQLEGKLQPLKPVRPKTTLKEANLAARKYLKEDPEIKARPLSKKIPCALGTISKLPVWQAIQEERAKSRRPRSAKTIRLTPELEQIAGAQDASLDKLINEQNADAEPSPLEGNPKRAKIYMRRNRS